MYSTVNLRIYAKMQFRFNISLNLCQNIISF